MPQAPITTVQHWTLGEARMNAMYFLEKSTPFRRYVASLASYCFRAETPTLSNINKSQSKCTYFYIISGVLSRYQVVMDMSFYYFSLAVTSCC